MTYFNSKLVFVLAAAFVFAANPLSAVAQTDTAPAVEESLGLDAGTDTATDMPPTEPQEAKIEKPAKKAKNTTAKNKKFAKSKDKTNKKSKKHKGS